jgi:hypothetical protein
MKGVMALAILGVLVARISETLSLLGQSAIQIGLLHDSICYLGSYEIVVCSAILPPYETVIAVLVAALAILIFSGPRKAK